MVKFFLKIFFLAVSHTNYDVTILGIPKILNLMFDLPIDICECNLLTIIFTNKKM